MRSQEARIKAKAFTIFETIEASPQLQDLLTIVTSDNKKSFFIAKLLIALPGAFPGHTESPPELFGLLTDWFGYLKDAPSRFEAVATALKLRHKHFIDNRNQKLDFIHRIGLNWSPATRDFFLKGLKTVNLPKQKTPYPPINYWMCESDAIDQKWRDYLKYDPRAQPDRRRKRQPIFRTDPSKLSLDIEADQSAVVCDAQTGELIMLVLRDFCTDPDLLSHIEGVIKQAVECRKSMRVSHFSNL